MMRYLMQQRRASLKLLAPTAAELERYHDGHYIASSIAAVLLLSAPAAVQLGSLSGINAFVSLG